MQDQNHLNYFQIAWQSALASAFSLGLPAGFSLWLILFQQIYRFPVVDRLSNLFQAYGLTRIYLVAISSVLWSYWLGRISGYRPWWRLGLVSAVAILMAWFSPLANVDGILFKLDSTLPVHLNYAASMAGLVGGVTGLVGLGYGILLRRINAAWMMALSTSLVSILTLLMTIFLFDQFGIRVGTGNFAMSKVTVTGLLTSSITGGMVLGVEFSRFVREKNSQLKN